MHSATFCILVRENKEILLGMKKRGFGKDRYNGFGGKPNENESIEEAAIRELSEEVGIKVTPYSIKKVGELTFKFPSVPEDKNWNQLVHVYLVNDWSGKPIETEEMKPELFSIQNIPYEKMWPDDKYWLPHVLNGKYVEGLFVFGANQTTIIEKRINIK